MKKNAFTLIELIGIIIILGLVLLIASPAIKGVIKSGKQELYESQINSIKQSLKNWTIDNISLLPINEKESITLTLGQLKDDGYAEIEIINPKTNKCFGNDMLLTVTKYQKGYIYKVIENSGVETNECGVTSQPSIVLNGAPIVYVEVNTPYVELGATAVNSENEDISSQIITTISGGASSIDTSVIGNSYVISYTVTDGERTLTNNRTVIVRDTTPPVITIPSNTVLTTETTTFDVMEGVSATDNSGEEIQVTSSSNLSIGVPGTYTIIYTASDSSNNQASVTRTLIIQDRNPLILLNGNSTVYVEINTPYTELGATAQSYDGTNLTSQIVTTTNGGTSPINTSVLGNYIVSYTVTDDGLTSSVDRTVIVRDTTPPVITIPSNTVITTGATTFDLLDGVSAVDNSGGNVTITPYNNTISLGIPGTYTVMYRATDESNNQVSVTRTVVITTEAYVGDVSAPELKTGMIPVNIANDGTVTKADTNSVWYDYANKVWANAVTVSSTTRNTYIDAAPGTTIQANDILTYLVWIPRYKYELWNVGTTNPSKSTPHSINIVFEDKNTTKSTGTANGEYLTHPAFTFGEEELDGIWVGKFETSRNSTGSTNSAKVLIKPNVYSWRELKIKDIFNTVKGMNATGNVFGLSTDSDTHMMKNIEWGAVAYLSHSQYGKDGEVYINNQRDYKTGCGGDSAKESDSSSCKNAYGSKSDGIYNQSTTGNISGIFDMSGGTMELVMGYTTAKSSCSWYDGDCSGFTSDSFPEDKYVDKYSSTSETQYSNRILGDATGEMGPFSHSEGSWYSNYSTFVSRSYPWFARGGEEYDEAGLFTFDYAHGDTDYIYEWTFRAVIV